MSKRTLPLAIVLALALSVVGALPSQRARVETFPPTVARRVAIPLAPLVGGAPTSALVTRAGELRTTAPLRTRAERVCSPMWSTMVALTWDQTGGGPVSVSLERGGHASHQLSVVQDVDAEPGLGTAESGGVKPSSDLYWTGGSRCIRLSFRLPGEVVLSNPRAVFINTSGTAAGPGTGPPERAPTDGGMLGGLFGASAAEAMTTRPPIVRRYQWGAAKPRPNCLEYAPEIKMAYVHHTSGSNSYPRSQSDDIVRGIQYYHEHVRGYCDIAYSFLVDRFGRVFVGRYDSDNTAVNV